MSSLCLNQLEDEASKAGLVLRLQVRRPLGLWALRVVVAQYIEPNKIQLLGEMKAWAYNRINGLQLDTMKVDRSAQVGVGDLVWAATMAWALEMTPCRNARLLAIRDDDRQHSRLIRYFAQRGFYLVREVGSAPSDLPFRMVWGGAGSLMSANCDQVLKISYRRWQTAYSKLYL